MKNLKGVFNLLLFPFVFVFFLTASLLGASTEPNVSISTTAPNVAWGTSSVDLILTASPEANVSSITVNYTNSYTGGSSSIGIDANTSTSILTISTAGIPSGTDFNITLTSVTGDGTGQSDGTISSGTATITITNKPPVAKNKTYSVSINDTLLIGNIITDSPPDSDPDGNLITLAGHSNPSNAITIDTDGNFEYTPTTNFCGVDSFDYNITDGDLNSTATITIDNIQNTLDTPVDDSFLINRVDQTLLGNVLTNDLNQTYTVSFSQPSNGIVTNNGEGNFTYVADGNFTGEVSFDYNVTDGTCSTATATVTIKITDMCNHVIPFDLCSVLPTTNTIIEDDPQVYSFELNASVMLDLNLTNTGNKLLEYDFREGDCDSLFAEQTTSYLPQGASIDIRKEYPAATYFLGLGVGQNQTDILLSICYDTNISGNDGQAYSHIGINDINSTPDSNDWYDIFPNITTKVVNKPFDIRASYLDENQDTDEYDGRYDKNGEVGMSIILSMAQTTAQGTCKKINNSIVATMILDHGEWYKESINTIINIPYAAKNRQLHITSFDFGALFRAATGLNCGNSSLSSSLCLLPACFNTINNIKAVFPPAFYPKVLTCVYGDGGGLSPCNSQAYTGGCGGKKEGTISPSIYDNDLGCASCLQDAMELNVCSDTFAIRPDRFDVEITDPDFPNLLHAGQEYGVSLTALDAEGNDTITGYTITSPNNFNDDLAIDTTKYFKDGTKDDPINSLLHGTPDLNKSITAYMLTGFSSLNPTTRPVSAEEIVKVSYDDVGKVELHIYDFRWAEIDNKDTPMDCNSTEHTYICGDKNVTFIPDHFRVDNIHLRNHNDGNFTYLSNDLNMSAHIDVNISAMNAKDDPTKDINITHITQNFKQGSRYYENPVSVDINVTEWNTTTPLTRHPKDNMTHKHDIPTEMLLGFGGSDADGTHLIPWDETNTTQQLMFNYTRQNNQTVNPFEINGTDINITVQSTYTDSTGLTPSSPAIITGTGIGDKNATFVYGRAKTADIDDYYDGISAASIITPATILVYCDKWPASATNCPGVDIVNDQANINYWWLSTGHDMTGSNDGNITLRVGAGSGSLNHTVVSINAGDAGVDDSIVVSGTGTVDIDLDTGTNSWLIYNPASAILNPIPFYRVRFIGTSDWTGHGKTGHVIGSDASKKKNNRLGW